MQKRTEELSNRKKTAEERAGGKERERKKDINTKTKKGREKKR